MKVAELMHRTVAGEATLTCLQASIWPEDGRPHLVRSSDEALTAEGLHHALDMHGESSVVWLEMELTGEGVKFFHEYYEPWMDVRRPVPDWTPVDPLLQLLSIESPGADVVTEGLHEKRVLSALPLAYEIGLPRIWTEFCEHDNEAMPVYPALGFWPCRPGNLEDLDFWVVPVNVGVVGNTVITVRLPPWTIGPTADTTPPDTCPLKTLHLPSRFRPVDASPTAERVAGAIAIYLAGTARAVAQRGTRSLRRVESEALSRIGLPETVEERKPDPEHRYAGDLLRGFRDVADTVHEVNRLLAHLVRRLGQENEKRFETQLYVQRRYGTAHAEIQTLQGVLRDAGQMITGALSARLLEATQRHLDATQRHLEATQHHQESISRFEQAATVFGSLVLIPTLIAGIYGANVELPGEDGTNFVAMLGFMAFGSATVWVAITRSILRHPWTRGKVAALVWALVGLGIGLTLSLQ